MITMPMTTTTTMAVIKRCKNKINGGSDIFDVVVVVVVAVDLKVEPVKRSVWLRDFFLLVIGRRLNVEEGHLIELSIFCSCHDDIVRRVSCPTLQLSSSSTTIFDTLV